MNTKFDLTTLKTAVFKLSLKSEDNKNIFLIRLANSLIKNKRKIITANKKDLNRAVKNHLAIAFIQRLTLDEQAISNMVLKIKEIQLLKSGLGEIIEEKRMENGLKLQKVRVPIGVIAVIYEARPEVTVDIAALCIKSGNAVILKDGSETLQTNGVLYRCIVESLQKWTCQKSQFILLTPMTVR